MKLVREVLKQNLYLTFRSNDSSLLYVENISILFLFFSSILCKCAMICTTSSIDSPIAWAGSSGVEWRACVSGRLCFRIKLI